ncbi:MAG TPA: lanthionine synthetase LanC family protein [Gemmatimonas sp.]|uniref:lanthionine synthetase LanC family protein n=1 Tax=Gemmatimonas sp. TaxID=1962908 RepID=UPI002EDB66EC
MDRRDLLKRVVIGSGVLAAPRWLLAAGDGDTRAPLVAADYRAAALGAERWITASAQREGDVVRWPVDPSKPTTVDQSLYSGMPGVVLLHLELHHATGDARHLQEAQAGARAMIAALPSDGLGMGGAGLYTGLTGIAYVLQLVQDRAPFPGGQEALARIARQVRDSTTWKGESATWIDSTDIISGTAGIALALVWLQGRDRSTASPWRDVDRQLRGAARSLLDAGVAEGNGTKWAISDKTPRRYPNFSHGTAGVSYTLATLAMHPALAGDRTLQQAARNGALSGARYLDAISTVSPGGSRKIFHSEPGNESLYYLSWCHGPAGTGRLYRQLERLTGDAAWRRYQPALAKAIVESGVPEQHPDRSGFWNNISQCCGNCGVAEYFISRHTATRSADDLAFAQRVMDDVVTRATSDNGGLKWVQAENRTSPEDVVAQTGYMQGAAGVGIALLHLEGAMRGRKPLVVLPDSPSWT